MATIWGVIMARFLALIFLISCLVLAGCDLPAPPQYDHAMLREFFGKSPKEVEDAFGKPSFVRHIDARLPPEDATKDEQEQFNRVTESMRYEYSTVDGDLVFHFTLNNSVHVITYGGDKVSPR